MWYYLCTGIYWLLFFYFDFFFIISLSNVFMMFCHSIIHISMNNYIWYILVNLEFRIQRKLDGLFQVMTFIFSDIDTYGRLQTIIYDKHDDSIFRIVNFTLFKRNKSFALMCDVYISHVKCSTTEYSLFTVSLHESVLDP